MKTIVSWIFAIPRIILAALLGTLGAIIVIGGVIFMESYQGILWITTHTKKIPAVPMKDRTRKNLLNQAETSLNDLREYYLWQAERILKRIGEL